MRAALGSVILLVVLAAASVAVGSVSAIGVDVAGDDSIVVATNWRERHKKERPTRGFVDAEMVSELPNPTQVSKRARAAAAAADSIITTETVESEQLHPARVAVTAFNSEPILSAGAQAKADAMEAANSGDGLFTPAPLNSDESASESVDSYVEINSALGLWTETERAAAEELSLAEVRARVGSSPRSYLTFFGASNTGTVMARYPNQNAVDCQERCEADAACMGFSIARPTAAAGDRGVCTLRSTWGNSIENPNFDSFQAHDFTVRNLPFRDLALSVKTKSEGTQLFIMADIARIRPESNKKHINLVATVDQRQTDGITTNIAAHYPSQPKQTPKSKVKLSPAAAAAAAAVAADAAAKPNLSDFRAPSFAGITHPLPMGDHTVRVQYTTNAQAVAPIESDESNGAGCEQQRLTVIPLPITVDARQSYELVGQIWNIAMTGSIASTEYVSLPGGEDGGAMRMRLAVPTDGARLFVVADINRVQHSHGWTNSRFALSVDGKMIGYTNSGEHYGWQYRAVSIRAASQPLKRGEHTIEVKAATQHGRMYLLSDGHGFQQRRISAIIVPPNRMWNKNWNLATSFKAFKPAKPIAPPADAAADKPTAAAPAARTEWANLPGADMAMNFTTPIPGQLFVNAAISRVQSWATANVEFRLVLTSAADEDGEAEPTLETVLAVTNTGQINGWRFHDVAFHGTSALVGPGKHSVRVQVRTTEGTVVFYNDANGQQQRRLSAILFPPATIEHVTQSGVCDKTK